MRKEATHGESDLLLPSECPQATFRVTDDARGTGLGGFFQVPSSDPPKHELGSKVRPVGFAAVWVCGLPELILFLLLGYGCIQSRQRRGGLGKYFGEMGKRPERSQTKLFRAED
jgi:hypothetical protein